ncbi:vWA domain-containing protein [Gorillibacterium timonense]|uniref:VWA domain-containing protein n=1 Tax=Gorillibacterium timonense TaxID=1689269 RepID=UPI00071DC34B|nr:VWA domain-containing protein [Gorillibacterium timonense]
MKQIILITDGCSNVGVSPVVAAAHALSEGITVNVVGVVDQGEIGELGSEEIREIARAGGGLSRMVGSASLSQTVQMMTRKTVSHTIRQVVGAELKAIMGQESMELTDLPPDKRAQVVRVIDEMEETAALEVALLVDASASMKPKLAAVREAVRDLMKSLEARSGASRLAVLRFPGASGEEVRVEQAWSGRLAKVGELFYNINMKGTTPTGPAILQTVKYFAGEGKSGGLLTEKTTGTTAERRQTKDGIWSDYVV